MIHALKSGSFELNASYVTVGKNEVFDRLKIIGGSLVLLNSKNNEFFSVKALDDKAILDIFDEVTTLITDVKTIQPTLYNPLDKIGK